MSEMNRKSLKVLVYGGTGSQGSAVVRALLEKGHKPFVLSRNGTKAEELVKAGAEIVIGNVNDKASLIAASKDMDAISLMTPIFTDVPPAVTARNAILAAQEANVPYIVWNTSGQAPEEKVGNPLLDHQHETTRILAESGLKYVKLIPTIFTENLLGPYTAPFVAKEDKLTYPTPEDMEINWLPTSDLGKLVVAALEKPELSGNSFLVASPERMNGKKLAEAFSEGLDRKIHYQVMPPKEFGAILDKEFGPGSGEAVAKDYQRFHDDPSTRNAWQIDTKPMLDALGVKMTPIAEWVRQYKDAFTDNEKRQ